MKLISKKVISHTIAFVLGAIVFVIIGVYAASTLSSSSVYYDNSESGGSSTNVSGAIDELYEKISKSHCVERGELVTFKVGDYVKMTPNDKEYTLKSHYTGYTSDQVINPSELTLWRVIHLNSDNTVTIISEYTTSVKIYFGGVVGYQYFVSNLNGLANLYENSCYTMGSRPIGYNSQTSVIHDTSKLTSSTAPWTSGTGTSNTIYSAEVLGFGDNLHTSDTSMVKSALGTLVANEVGTTTPTNYWLASRIYGYGGTNSWSYYGKIIDTSGNVEVNDTTGFYNMRTNFVSYTFGNAFRPMLNLKENIKAEGSGTAEDPYVLN